MQIRGYGHPYILIALAILPASFGCSRGLSRGHAASLIRQSDEFKAGWPEFLSDGLDCQTPGNLPASEFQKKMVQRYEGLKRMGYVQAFEVLPINTIFGPCGNWDMRYGVPGVRVSLSDDAKRRLAPIGPNRYRLIIADRELIQVTGITSPQGAGAESQCEAQFTYKWEPNEVGIRFAKEVEPHLQEAWGVTKEGRAFFRLYDDGYRLEKVEY